jgi:hypothetical protein
MVFIQIVGAILAVLALFFVGGWIYGRINGLALERHGRPFFSKTKLVLLVIGAFLCHVSILVLVGEPSWTWIGTDNAYAMLGTGSVLVLGVIAYNFKVFSPAVALPGTAAELVAAVVAAIFVIFLVVLFVALFFLKGTTELASPTPTVRVENLH